MALQRQATKFSKDGKPRPRLVMRQATTLRRAPTGFGSTGFGSGSSLVDQLKKQIDDLKRENSYLRGQSESAVSELSESRVVTERNVEPFEIYGQGVIGFLLVRDPSIQNYSFHLRGDKNLVLEISDKHIKFEKKMIHIPEDSTTRFINFKPEEQWVWVSIDHFNQKINIGIGFINCASIVATITLEEFDERLSTVKEIAINGVIPLKTRSKWLPVVRDFAPAVVSNDALNLWDIYNGTAVTIDTLPLECKELYSQVAGDGISLKKLDIEAIEYSLATPGCRLHEICREKSEDNEFDDPTKVYVRCTMGAFEGNSPGAPFVLELWPTGCSSPIHNHSEACAVIKVLHGQIDVSWYDPIAPAGKKNDVTGKQLPRCIGAARFMKDQVTWLTEDMYGCHKLENTHESDTCITLQCYQYHSSDKGHYEFFNFIVDSEEGLTTQQFLPDSDIDFGEMMRVVHSELAQSNKSGWQEGDRFILTEDEELLTALCNKHNIEHPGSCGLPGVIKNIAGPIADVVYTHGPDDAVEKMPLKALQSEKAFSTDSPPTKALSVAKFGTPQTQTKPNIDLKATATTDLELQTSFHQVASRWQKISPEERRQSQPLTHIIE